MPKFLKLVPNKLPMFGVMTLLLSSGSAFGQAKSTAPPAAASVAPAGYVIGAGDVLQIDVWKEPEITGQVVVRPDGTISVPVVKEIMAGGLTPGELEKPLKGKLTPLIRDVDVTVIVKEIKSAKIYFLGAVRREGPLTLQGPLTVLQAIAEVGGLTDYAKRNRIYILRGQTRLLFDYTAVVRGEHQEQNIMVRAGDTIVVP